MATTQLTRSIRLSHFSAHPLTRTPGGRRDWAVVCRRPSFEARGELFVGML